MTRNSTKELFTHLDNKKRVFCSKRRLFETPGLVESNSPKFDLFFDIEDRSEEEVTEVMTETTEQYMSKTRGDYGSGVTRPKIDINAHFELKGQFLKELCDNTFSGSEHEDANKHKKFWRLQILDSKGAIPTKTAIDAKLAIQEMAEYSKKWHNGTSRTRSTKTSDRLAAIQAQLNSLGREIKKILETYSMRTTLHNNTLPQKEKDPGSFTLPYFIQNVCFDKALVDLRASVSVMPFSTYTNLGLGDLAHTRLTIELADRIIKHPRGIAENVLVRIGEFIFPTDLIILDLPEDDDVPLILG
ncbi:gag-pol polyprotein [Tanacetum coccineum]